MGVLEDAIREHLDLKRSRGADPSEIERQEQEALGPVRRGPGSAGGLESILDGHAAPGHSPVEYHDSTAPHWQQDEDFGEHHTDLPPEAVEPEPVKRRGFLRRSRGDAAPAREPEAPLGWPESPAHDNGFSDDHFAPGYAGEAEPGYDPGAYDQGDPHALGYDEPQFHEPPYGGAVPAPDATQHAVDEPSYEPGALDEHPQVGGRFEPDYAPPTEVYVPPFDPVDSVEVEALAAPTEPDPTAPQPPPAVPAAGAHHPILDDLPVYAPQETESGVEPAVDPGGDAEPEAVRSDSTLEPPAAPTSQPATAPLQSIDSPATAPESEPPQLQFDRPPQRPTFRTEPPHLRDADDAPKPPDRSRKSGRVDDLQGTLEFDVAGELEGDDAGEDVLEVTPDFLQDTPEHDRLWFEQRPPRDFDFDG